jgi:glutamate/tyrosine decarboxylase-like PLP-dependent enzyme
VFVQGGTLGNLSALVAARYKAKAARIASGQPMPASWKFICSSEAHSSLKAAAAVMDVEIIKAPVDAFGKLQGSSVAEAIANAGDGVFAVVATGGTTNFGIVDNLDSVGQAAKAAGLWFHVDGAYGLAGMLAPSTKQLFKGLDRADSFIVDPHKWLYAPFDACALVYRDPEDGRKAHTQHGEYLDILTETGDWNPSDYAYNLTRRPRGLPLWFSLATHGVAAYREAIETNNRVARQIAEVIRATEGLELVRDPELSVVVFVKQGWQLADYEAWSTKLLERGQAFVVPSSHNGQPNARFAIVNPQTTVELLVAILNSMDE